MQMRRTVVVHGKVIALPFVEKPCRIGGTTVRSVGVCLRLSADIGEAVQGGRLMIELRIVIRGFYGAEQLVSDSVICPVRRFSVPHRHIHLVDPLPRLIP